MELLEKVALAGMLVVGAAAHGAFEQGKLEQGKIEQGRQTSKVLINCQAADEFKKAVEFFRTENGISLNDRQSFREALMISAGCDHSFARFFKVFQLLKKSGVDLNQSYNIALKFVSKDDATAELFVDIFKKIYLENYLNMDFSTALKYALLLSENAESDAEKLMKDFSQLVRFCTSEQEMALSLSVCAQVALDLTQHVKYYPEGIFASFEKIYRFLRSHKQTGLSIPKALQIATQILAKGPQAPENFVKTFQFAIDSQNLNLSPTQALNLGLSVSEQSQKSQESK